MANDLLKTQDQKSSYVIGYEMAKQFQSTKGYVDFDSMVLGLRDQFQNDVSRLNDEEMRKGMMHYQDREREIEVKMLMKLSKQNSEEGNVYREANKKKKGVVTLPSGLQYKIIKSGNGKISPKRSTTVVAHYHGTLLDGTVFDSSYKRKKPITFPLNRVIKGWTEALLKMKEGDKWQIVIPSELAYGQSGVPPRIPPGATLLFDVELLEIKK